MNPDVALFSEVYNHVAVDCQKYCFTTRAIELQIEAYDRLSTLRQQASELKKRMVSIKDEDAANAMLSFESMIDAVSHELRMWILLKEDDPDAAWDALVEAQGAARRAMHAHSFAAHLEGYVSHLHILETHLFPVQLFLSIGTLIKSSRCSICDREYEECDHIAGRPYMGEMCGRIIENAHLQEVSIVDVPANKHARAFQMTDGDGIRRHVMSWRPVNDI